MFLRFGVLFSIFCCALAPAGIEDPLAWVSNAGGAVARDAQGQVVAVDLRASWATDSELDSLAGIPTLSRLDLSETRITDHGLRRLKNASAITDLNLRYAELITGEGLSSLKHWTQLKRLDMEGTKVTDNTLQHLSAFTSLESLNLSSVLVTDAGLDALTSLPHLRELTLGGNKLTDAGLQALRQLPGLTYLDLGGTQREDSGLWSVSLTQPGLDTIATLKELRRLKLDGTLITARGLATLQVLSNLEELDLHDCARVGDDVIPVLSAMPGLRSVDLAGTKVTGAGIAQLKKAKPNCLVRGGGAAAKSDAQIDER
jgi:hypothetical protein